MSRKKTRGQINAVDAMFALIVFGIIFAFIVNFWALNIHEANNKISLSRLEQTAMTATDIMIKSPGQPKNWEANSTNAQMIGLASESHELSDYKLANFSAMNYSTAKQLLGVSGEFYFFVQDLNNNRLYQAGNSSFARAKNLVSITRYATLNNEKVRVRITLYE